MIGVSPAYFISRYTDRFTANDIVKALPDIKAMGYDGFEPEIFHSDMITRWKDGGARNVHLAAEDNGLTPTQFVAHFLVKAFDTTVSLASPFGLVEIREVLDMLDEFDSISTVVVPFSAFRNGGGLLKADNGNGYRQRMLEKLGAMLGYVESSGRRMALEIMPGSLIGGFDDFLAVCDALESDTLGINLDTGHANAMGEDLSTVHDLLGSRILGTHLCDNFAVENLSLAPGKAQIDFKAIINGLRHIGYTGSWDVEIICNPAEIKREYASGLEHIRSVIPG